MIKRRARLSWFYIIVVMIITQIACGTFDVLILTPTPNIMTPSSKKQEVEEQVISSNSPSPFPSQENLFDEKPGFSDTVFFSYEPDTKRTQRVFPRGTKQVFAIWNYYNMREGILVKQVWYRNSEEWFTQENTWDFKRYGEKGTISDVTLYDLEKGLGEGIYWLRLFIDGIEQTSPFSHEKSSFRVINTNVIIAPEPSPENGISIHLLDPRTILIQLQGNTQKTISTPLEIASINLFPDYQHILVSQRDRSNQNLEASPSGIRDELWITDIETGIRIRISTPEENLHLPSISPDGRFIVTISGTGQLKACQADLSIAIIELDDNYNRVSIQYLENFSGLPNKTPKPYPVNHPVVPLPGRWLDQYRMMTAIKFPCTPGEYDGIYILNFHTWQIERAP